MSPKAFLARIFDPAYAAATPLIGIPASQEARVLLMAIAGQESDWQARLQQGAPQYGRGFWQFESNGCSALATNATSEPKMTALLQGLAIPIVLPTIHEAIAWNDAMAVGMARLLLYCDPAPLPIVGDHEASWEMYVRCWHPGKPRPDDWPTNYDAAMEACGRPEAT